MLHFTINSTHFRTRSVPRDILVSVNSFLGQAFNKPNSATTNPIPDKFAQYEGTRADVDYFEVKDPYEIT